jgi:hypothetical protein
MWIFATLMAFMAFQSHVNAQYDCEPYGVQTFPTDYCDKFILVSSIFFLILIFF